MMNNISYKTGKALLFVTSSFFLSNVSLGTFFIPNIDLGRPNGDLGIPNGDLGIPNGDLGIPNGDLGIPNGDLGIPNVKAVRKWTKGEDEQLLALVETYGAGKWAKIATGIPSRTAKQCRMRWIYTLASGIRRRPWTKGEDEQLLALVKTHGAGKWAKIARGIPGKTPHQCREHWFNIAPGINRNKWTTGEDEKLLALVKAHGAWNWTKIAEQLPGRTAKQCRDHYRRHLEPRLQQRLSQGLAPDRAPGAAPGSVFNPCNVWHLLNIH